MNIERQLKPSASQTSLPQQVREMALFVAQKADFVRIREERIGAYTADVLKRYPVITSLDAQNHFLSEASPAATAAFVLALDSVNFGSGYFKASKEAGVPLEYNFVAGCLRKAFSGSRMNTAEKWLSATATDMHDIFGVPQGRLRQLDRLMGYFADHLGATGQYMLESYDGEPLNLIEAAQNSAVRLTEIVAGWPSFRDVAQYKGAEVPFIKRAQILAADIHLAFEGKAPAAFTDIAEL
ncbi:MAG: queuosine salvage family protein, partial [Alphaproteobacteria bacterium]